MIDGTFWRGRRVLVTGHTGFKGSWLSLWLHSLGARVTGYALGPPSEPSHFELARVGEVVEDVRGDVRDAAALRAAVAEAGPEVLIHMAAQAVVGRGITEPALTFETNVMGAVNLLEAVRALAERPRSLVLVTSDKCYFNYEVERAYREDDALGGEDPYSSSKACQEHVAAAYRASLGVRLATARAGNVIGGGDWAADRLVPDFMRALAAHRAMTVRRPEAIRPWQHVLNPLSGYLLLAERLWSSARWAQSWNFAPAPEEARTVEWMLSRLAARNQAPPAGAAGNGTGLGGHEATLLRLDAAKARDELGWRPLLDLGAALDATSAWYAAQRRGEDMRAVTLAQIQAFTGARPAAAAARA